MRADNLKLAILYSLLAAFFYAVLGVLIKITEKAGSTDEMIVFFRQAIGFIALSPFLIKDYSKIKALKSEQFSLHLLRAFSSIASMYCLVYCLKYLPLTDALLLSYTRPLFIPIVVFIWFRKKWSKSTWLGLIVGFLGIALILKPDKLMFDIAALVGLGSALFGAIAFTSIRKLTKNDSANLIFFYYCALSLPIAALPLVRGWRTPSGFEWLMFLIIGIFGMFYQMSLTRAYQYAKAYKIASMLYSTVIFAIIFDLYLGDFVLDYVGFLGIILVTVGTIITIKQPETPFPPESPKNTTKN